MLLTPFMEQSPLHGKYNFGACSSMSSPYGHAIANGTTDATNDGVYNTRLEVLECPSHPEAGIESTVGSGGTGFYSRLKAKRTSYLFSAGYYSDYESPYETKNGNRQQGAFGNDGAARIANITDGTSNCILVGEAASGRYKTSGEYGPWGMTGTHTCCHGIVQVGTVTNNVLAPTALERSRWGINQPWEGDIQGRTYAWVYGSLHPGGAQFTLCDASTRFIAQTIDFNTWARLNYIHDREPVSGF
jgi:hypothetical protein